MYKSVRLRDILFVGVALLAAILLIAPRGGDSTAAGTGKTYLPVVRRQPSPTPTKTPTATPSPTPGPGWYVEYFGNPSLAGAPFRAQTEEYDLPEKSWGESPPLPGMPADNFSVRFSATKQFQAGNYAFLISVDDGGRLYVDGNLVIDQWRGSPRGTATYRWDGAISGGNHQIKLEYYDAAKGAQVRLLWINQDLYPNWRAEYWANDSMSGAPAVVRNEAEIKYDWGLGGPDVSLPVDGFSARWTQAFYLTQGKYVFYTTAEGGGMRLWIDKWVPNQDEIIDDWTIWPNRTRSKDEYLDETGWYLVTVAYRAGAGKSYCRYRHLYGGASSTWPGEYYKKMDLTDLFTVRNDGRIEFDWGLDRPMAGMPKDNWSVRWIHTEKLDANAYTFKATIDDGCRVWVNDSLVINEWREGGKRTAQNDIVLHKGSHVIKMEYFENVSNAYAQLTFEPNPDIQFFRADYWNEVRMGGDKTPDWTEYMDTVHVDAGLGAPAAGIRADDWSARFVERRDFPSAGTYKFTVEYDGGAVLYVDGKERWNDWNNTGRKVKTYTQHLEKGQTWVKLHYADRGANSNGYVHMDIVKQ